MGFIGFKVLRFIGFGVSGFIGFGASRLRVYSEICTRKMEKGSTSFELAVRRMPRLKSRALNPKRSWKPSEVDKCHLRSKPPPNGELTLAVYRV